MILHQIAGKLQLRISKSRHKNPERSQVLAGVAATSRLPRLTVVASAAGKRFLRC